MRENPRPLFKQSAETLSVCKLLLLAKPGEIVTYDQMRREIRAPVSDDVLHGAIQSARRTMLRDHRRVYSAVPKVGYQLLTADEVVQASDQDARQIRRKAQRATAKLATVEIEELQPEAQGKHAARIAVFSAVSGWFETGRKRLLPSNGAAPAVSPIQQIADAASSAQRSQRR
jgi:hypothetical protein